MANYSDTAEHHADIGTAMDVAAIADCLTEASAANDRLVHACLARSVQDQKQEAVEIKKFSDRISALAEMLNARLAAQLQRKQKVA